MVVGFFGWNMRGAQVITACETEQERSDALALAFWVRLPVMAIVAPAAVAVSALLSPPGGHLFAAWMGLGSCLVALSATWFGIGVGQPRFNILFDSVPRLTFILLSIPAILITGDPLWYPIGVVVGGAAAILAVNFRVFGRWVPPAPPRHRIVGGVRESLSAASIDPVAAVYNSAPLPMASIANLSATELAGLASADKLYRLGRQALSLLTDSLLAWVLDPDEAAHRRRLRMALLGHVGVAVVGFCVLAVFGGHFTALLFGADLVAPEHFLGWYGVAFVAVSLSTPLIRYLYIPRGRSRSVAYATVVASLLGLSMMIVWPQNSVIGLAGAEWVLLAGLLLGLAGRARSRRTANTRAEEPHEYTE